MTTTRYGYWWVRDRVRFESANAIVCVKQFVWYSNKGVEIESASIHSQAIGSGHKEGEARPRCCIS